MFSKLIVAAIVGVALAGQDDDAVAIVKKQGLTSSFTARLAARLAAAQVNHGMLKDGIETAAVSINRVAAMQSSMSEAQDSVDALKSSAAGTVDDAIDDLSSKLSDAAAALQDSLADAAAENQGYVTELKEYAEDIVDTGMKAIKALSDDVENQIKVAKATQVEQQKCAAKQQVYSKDEDKCLVPIISPTAYMDAVHHSLWTNQDSREGGYLNGRDLSFTKYYENTYMRVMYYDNMRCHGHTSHGKWEIYICDEGGGGCNPCNDPGPLQHWRWSGHQHGWWMNDHTGGTIFGLCKSTSSINMGKGKYKLRLYLHQARYDLHTGHHGQHGSFTVDEVMKY